MDWAVFPPCCLTWGQSMTEVMRIMATSFKRSSACTATLSASNPAAGHRRPMPPRQRLLGTHKSGSLSCGVTASFFWVLVHTGSVCALQGSVSPVLCKFWQLYCGVNGDLLQEGLCHIQACCTQSPCPCSRPLLTRTSAGNTQTQLWRSPCGVSGSWCTQGLFEPSKHLWQVWGLILNVTSPPPTILLGLLLCSWL